MTAGRPGVRSTASWLGLVGLGVVLGGWMGVVGTVVVAVVILAGQPRRLIGVLGVASLACVPLFVLLAGLPARSGVSPAFVTATPWSHRLAFLGLFLVCVWAVLDLAPHVRRGAQEPSAAPEGAPPGSVTTLPAVAAYALVAVIALAAAVASMAVIGA